jgi:hypothetical protein
MLENASECRAVAEYRSFCFLNEKKEIFLINILVYTQGLDNGDPMDMTQWLTPKLSPDDHPSHTD